MSSSTPRSAAAATDATGGASGEAAAAAAGGEPARLRALSRMIVSMLGSVEAEQQLVGARAAAGRRGMGWCVCVCRGGRGG